MNEENQNQNNNHNKSPNRWPIFIFFILLTVLVIFLGSKFLGNFGGYFSEEISYDEFTQLIQKDQVKEAVLENGAKWQITLKGDLKTYYTEYLPDEEIIQLL